MFTPNSHNNDALDRAGRLVLHAATADHEQAEAAASSPFLFTRVRAAITAEQSRRAESGDWLSLIFVARRALPAMALVTLLVAVLTAWSVFTSTSMQNNFDEEALLGTPTNGVEQTVLAGNNLSQDDVINIVVDRDYGRNGK